MSALAELLAKFSRAHGASGYEDAVRSFFVRELEKRVDEIQITRLGSVIGIKRAARSRHSPDAPRVLVEAHLDEIGLVVTGIEDGFIRFEEIGHWDPRVLPSQNVVAHGRRTLPGVIGSRPPHVLSSDERKRSLAVRDLFVDVGMSDARVRELVSVGDFITLDRQLVPLQNDCYAGKALDDRAALVALLEMLRQLQSAKHAWDLYVVANVKEEDSAVYVGALTSTFQIRPQLAVAVDVTHAQQPGLNDENLPQPNGGPCIARGANAHPFVFDKLCQAATRAAVPYHVTVYGGDTETDAWMMQVTGEGVPTGLVEIPLRYMHTSVETLHLDDVTRAAALLREFVASLTLDDSSALQGETFVRETNTRAAPQHAARRAKRVTLRQSAERRASASRRGSARRITSRRRHRRTR